MPIKIQLTPYSHVGNLNLGGGFLNGQIMRLATDGEIQLTPYSHVGNLNLGGGFLNGQVMRLATDGVA